MKPDERAAELGRRRVRAFVDQVTAECMAGTDPATVAGALYDDLGLLPAPVRAALEQGDWSSAWHAACAINAGLSSLARYVEAEGVQRWLHAFAEAVQAEARENFAGLGEEAQAPQQNGAEGA